MHTDDTDHFQNLRQELTDIVANGAEVWSRQEQARRTRFCEWDGQSDDGRKHSDDLGEQAQPFEGAADTRVPLADLVINDEVALTTSAVFRAQVQAVPVESGDTARAARVSTFLRWLRDSKMRAELETEVELAHQYLFGDDPGVVVVEVQWRRDLMLERRALTFDGVAAMFATGAANPDEVPGDSEQLEPGMLGEFADLVFNPLRKAELLDWLRAAFPGAADAPLKRAAKALRETGEAELPVPVVRESRPGVQALRLFDEFFLPLGTADLQRARSVHRREWVNETELRERVLTMGWDADQVEEVIERGRGQSLVDGTAQQMGGAGGDLALSAPGRTVNETQWLFEIWWSYERRADELGVPAVWVTVWNPALKDAPLKEEICAYPHGKYPFVLRTRERVGRQVTDSRGCTRSTATAQYEVKVQRDARSNYTQLATTPPRKRKIGRGAYDLVLAPGADLDLQRMDDIEYLNPPPFPQASIEMENRTRQEMDEYHGRAVAGADPNRVALLQQRKTANCFALWREVFGQVLALCSEYMTPAELVRVTGPGGEELAVTPEDLRGNWDIFIELDARDLNMDYAMQKMKGFTELLGLDSGGSIDRTPLVAWAASSIDPVLARQALRPMGSVTGKQVADFKNAVAQMASGVEPPMPESGTNGQLGLQVLQQTIVGSPKLRQQYTGDELFRALVDNYQKYLMQQVAQERNKVIGRLGAEPMQGPTAETVAGVGN